LFRALPYIHECRPGPQRPIWIDAICLNQEDDIEKATHVPLMGTIYKQAKRVLIWLGEAANDSDLAMDGIDDLTRKILAVEPDGCQEVCSTQDLKCVGLPDINDPIWNALRVIQLRSWCFRLWTLQEAFVAAEAIVLCGTKNMPWEAITLLLDAALSRCLVMIFPIEMDVVNSRDAYSLLFTTLIGPRSPYSVNRSPMPLPSAILVSMNQHFKEPVDRIWAILALLKDDDRNFLTQANLIRYDPAARLNTTRPILIS
jgi:hypothetical protein